MSISIQSLEKKVEAKLSPTYMKFEDISDTCPGPKFSAVIVSKQFEGVPLLQRHRMVNEILADDIKNMHAFTQRTLTPEQWEQENH